MHSTAVPLIIGMSVILNRKHRPDVPKAAQISRDSRLLRNADKNSTKQWCNVGDRLSPTQLAHSNDARCCGAAYLSSQGAQHFVFSASTHTVMMCAESPENDVRSPFVLAFADRLVSSTIVLDLIYNRRMGEFRRNVHRYSRLLGPCAARELFSKSCNIA